MDPVSLSDKLATVLADPDIEDMLKVSQKTRAEILGRCKYPLLRTALRQFLECVYYAMAGVEDVGTKDPRVLWMFINDGILTKLLSISAALESEEDEHQIPTPLLILPASLLRLRKHRFEYLKKEKKVAMDLLLGTEGNDDFGKDYLDLYYGEEKEQSQKRAKVGGDK